MRNVILRGALLGLVTYAAYYLANLAALRDQPILVTAIDLLWGTVLTAVTSLFSVQLGRRFGQAARISLR